MYKLLIFDLDGTLLDTTEGIISALQNTIKHMALRELPYDVLRSFLGPPIHDSFKLNYPLLELDQIQNIVDYFRENYSKKHLFHAKLYENVNETLVKLKSKGYLLAVATYKREDYVLELLNHFGLDQYFNVIRGADKDGLIKKDEMINWCVDFLSVRYEETVMIGDSIYDYNSSQISGVDFIGVTYGFGYKAGKDYLNDGIKKVDNLLELTELMK